MMIQMKSQMSFTHIFSINLLLLQRVTQGGKLTDFSVDTFAQTKAPPKLLIIVVFANSVPGRDASIQSAGY